MGTIEERTQIVDFLFFLFFLTLDKMPVDWVQFNWMWINRIDHLCIRFSCGSKSYNDYFLFITPVDHVLVKIFSFILPSQLERSLSCTRPTMNGEAPSCYSAKQSIKKILTCQLNFFFLIPVCPFSYFWVVLIIMAILKLAFYFLLFFSFFFMLFSEAHPPGSTGLYVRLLQTRGFDQGRQHRESESCAEKAIINGSLLLV